MADGLQIRIAADVEAALRSLANIQKELEKTKLAGDNAAKGADAAARGFSKLPQSANQATLAMSNLGRVVQDAPFGFIAIANNLDPLLQSFQQLQKTSGGTTGALKSLLGSLSGPGGIALALSAVTSAITFAQLGFDRWFGGLSKNKGAVDEQAKEFTRLQEVIRSLGGSVGNLTIEFGASANAQISKVNALIAVVNNLNATDEERQNALTQLQQLNKAYFGDVTLSAKGLELLKSRQDEYNKALQNQAAQQGFINKLNDAEIESAKVENRVAALQKQLVNLRSELARTPRFEIKGQTEVETKRYRELQGQITTVNNELKNQESALNGLTDARSRLQQGISQTVTAGVGFKPLVEDKTSINKGVQDIIAEAKRISAATDETISLKLNITPFDSEAEQFEKSKEFLDKFKAGLYRYALTVPAAEINLPIALPKETSSIKEGVTAFGAVLSKEINDYFKSNTVIDYSLILAQLQKGAAKNNNFTFLNFSGLTKEAQELAQTGQMIANMFTPSLEAMIDAIGRGENAFKAFGEGVKAVLVQVIQKLAATAILAGVLAALFPGGLGGSQGFGAIFGKLLGFRANGGPVTGNSPYIVGERGPELFVPSVSGSIVPNNSVGSFMSGRGSDSGRGTTLRGQDIILAYARTQRSQLRVNG
jgi:predicted  nucleic acid-binding Zn-ribbon protein